MPPTIVKLNCFQRDTLSWYFNPENHEGDDWPTEPAELQIEIVDGNLRIDGVWLLPDGSWATFPPS